MLMAFYLHAFFPIPLHLFRRPADSNPRPELLRLHMLEGLRWGVNELLPDVKNLSEYKFFSRFLQSILFSLAEDTSITILFQKCPD
jgi:hypothetical protein